MADRIITKETILDNEYVSLYWYPEQKIIYHVFHKYMYGQEFRRALETGLEVMKKNGGTKWLGDDRANSALPTDDLVWSMEDWFFRAFDAGWRYWALVMPDKIAGQLNMNRILKRNIDLGMNIQVVESAEEGLEWLESVG